MALQMNDVQEPLDFGDFTNGESEDLREYKKLVREIALQTKKTERWCQDGFDEAMRRLGLKTKEPTAKIKIYTSHPFEFEVVVKCADYRDLTWTEQRDQVLAEVNEQLRKGPFAMQIPAESVVRMEAVLLDPEEAEEPQSDLFIWARNSPHNKFHRFERQVAEVVRDAYYSSVTSACGSITLSAYDVLNQGVDNPDDYSRCANCDR